MSGGKSERNTELEKKDLFSDEEISDLLLQKFYFGTDKVLFRGSYANLYTNCNLYKFEDDDSFSFPLELKRYKTNLMLGIIPHLLVDEKDISNNESFIYVWNAINRIHSLKNNLTIQQLLGCWTYFNYFHIDLNSQILSNWLDTLISKLKFSTSEIDFVMSSDNKTDIYNQFNRIILNLNKEMIGEKCRECSKIFISLVGLKKSTIGTCLLFKKVGYWNVIDLLGNICRGPKSIWSSGQFKYNKINLCDKNYDSIVKLIYQSEQPEILDSKDFKNEMSAQLELSMEQIEFVNLHIISKFLLENDVSIKNNLILTLQLDKNTEIRLSDNESKDSNGSKSELKEESKELKDFSSKIEAKDNITLKEYINLRTDSILNKTPIVATRKIILFEHLITKKYINVSINSKGFVLNEKKDIFFKSDIGVGASTLLELLIFIHIYYSDIFNDIYLDKYNYLMINGNNNHNFRFIEMRMMVNKIKESGSLDSNIVLNHCSYSLQEREYKNILDLTSELKIDLKPSSLISLDISSLNEEGKGVILVPSKENVYPIMKKVNLAPGCFIWICSTTLDKGKLFDTLTKLKIFEEKKEDGWNKFINDISNKDPISIDIFTKIFTGLLMASAISNK